MPYIEGFVAAVPTANKQVYLDHVKEAAGYFKSLGATRMVECWGDDVPRGELNDFFTAVHCKEDETPVFSWVEYPDKAVRDEANRKMMNDPAMADMTMPFDAKRMIFGGFVPIFDQ